MPEPTTEHGAPTAPIEPPHPNGSGLSPSPARPGRRRVVIAVLVAFVVAWAFAIWYSVTRPAGEPLDSTSARAVRTACIDAAALLTALDSDVAEPAEPAEPAEAAASRIDAENEVLTAMVASLRDIEPPDRDGRDALIAWLYDWEDVIAARRRYAQSLRQEGTARLELPSATSTKPVTVRMTEYSEAHGLEACTPRALQAEVVEGKRHYAEATASDD